MEPSPQSIDPMVLKHLVELGYLGLYAFAIFMGAIAIVFSVVFWKGNLSGESVSKIIETTDAPRFATIVLIVASVSVLATVGIVDGGAAITLLSGVAGYVLGNGANIARKSGKDSDKPDPS